MQLTAFTFSLRFSIPGKFAVERYPALKYIPSAFLPSKAQVLKQRQKDIDLYTELMDEVRDKVDKGTAQPCFAQYLLEQRASLGMSYLEIAYTAGSPFGAGVDTVRSLSEPADILRADMFGTTLVCRISSMLFSCMRQVWSIIHPQGTKGA